MVWKSSQPWLLSYLCIFSKAKMQMFKYLLGNYQIKCFVEVHRAQNRYLLIIALKGPNYPNY